MRPLLRCLLDLLLPEHLNLLPQLIRLLSFLLQLHLDVRQSRRGLSRSRLMNSMHSLRVNFILQTTTFVVGGSSGVG
jgi:hypothetical protein